MEDLEAEADRKKFLGDEKMNANKDKKNIYVSDAYLSVLSIIYLICIDYITIKYLNSSPKGFIFFYIIFFVHTIYFKEYYKDIPSESLALGFVCLIIFMLIRFNINFFDVISNGIGYGLVDISYIFIFISAVSFIDDLYNIYKDKNRKNIE